MTQINPIKLTGSWKEGYALDIHTTSSVLIGMNSYGREEFENTYSPIGSLLYDLKSKEKIAVIDSITSTATKFVQDKGWRLDLIVSVPPTYKRKIQPVGELAKLLAQKLGIPYHDCIQKVKETPELKNITDPTERTKLLEGAFEISNRDVIEGRSVLLFDDLYRSGATLTEICSGLKRLGVAQVYVLTITKTRRNR